MSMFFGDIPKGPRKQTKAQEEYQQQKEGKGPDPWHDTNSKGERKFVMDSEGHCVINDPDLLVSKVAGLDGGSEPDKKNLEVFIPGHGWVEMSRVVAYQ
jgi:hypothetical protein